MKTVLSFILGSNQLTLFILTRPISIRGLKIRVFILKTGRRRKLIGGGFFKCLVQRSEYCTDTTNLTINGAARILNSQGDISYNIVLDS